MKRLWRLWYVLRAAKPFRPLGLWRRFTFRRGFWTFNWAVSEFGYASRHLSEDEVNARIKRLIREVRASRAAPQYTDSATSSETEVRAI